MGNCYSQKQHERQLQVENIENIRPPAPPQPKPRIEESSSYETDSEASLPPPSIQPTVPTVSKRLSEDKIELQKPPPKPKRGIVGKMDETVIVEDGLKMTEYKHSESITSSMSDFDDSLDYLNDPVDDDLPVTTVYHVGATQTSPSWTDEFLSSRQAEMLRQQPPIKYPVPSLAPKSSSYLRMPPAKEKTLNDSSATGGNSAKWQHYKELQSRVDSAISSLGDFSPEGTFSIKDRSFARSQNLPLERTAHKDLEDTRKKLYSVLDDAFYLTSPNGVNFASKTLSTSLPPVDNSHQNYSFTDDFKSNMLSQSLRSEPPDSVDDLIAHSSSLRKILK